MDLSLSTVITLVVGVAAGAFIFWVGNLIASRRRVDEDYYQDEAEGLEMTTDPFVKGRYQERRGAARRGGNPIAVLITDEAVEAEPIRGYVLDRSTGGLCISCEAEIEEGTILSVRTANAPETAPWVQIEVRNCRRNGREYEIGCQWLRTPPWSVLLLFG
jgi:hypothetical protein